MHFKGTKKTFRYTNPACDVNMTYFRFRPKFARSIKNLYKLFARKTTIDDYLLRYVVTTGVAFIVGVPDDYNSVRYI